MTTALIRFLDWFLALTRLQYWPVRVRAGIAAGARWTLYPWSAYWRGTQEPALHQAMLGLGDIRGWCCWDLGAHFGIYSIGLARRTGPTGEVAGFEPNPVSYARLERHRRMNGITWMKTFEAAVSDQAGSAELLTYGDLRSTTTHLAYETETVGAITRPIAVPTVVLDDLVASGRLRPPDFIKVDVEGHAHRALSGARRTLAAKRPILIVAFHSEPEVRGVLDLLTPLGYGHTPVGASPGGPEGLVGHDLLFRPMPRP
jgi:FkbM family methyltransferase